MDSDIQRLQEQLKSAVLPDDLRAKTEELLARISRGGGNYDQAVHYIDWIIHLPWNTSTKDILDLGHARQILDQHHYGLTDLKERILEYLSVLILNEQKSLSYHAPILLLVGLVGTGKNHPGQIYSRGLRTQICAHPLWWYGLGLDLRGQSRVHPDAEVGQIIKAIRRAECKNPVILLDEIDRVADSTRGEIMGVLVELLDPEQNAGFVDHYIDYPFDLSQVLFIATCNNTTSISTAVMDRLEPLSMPSYTDEEKIKIGRDYVLPREIQTAGLSPSVIKIDDAVWPQVVRPLGFDAGIRTLERTIQGIVRKIAKLIVEGKGKEFYITADNLKQFLPSY